MVCLNFSNNREQRLKILWIVNFSYFCQFSRLVLVSTGQFYCLLEQDPIFFIDLPSANAFSALLLRNSVEV